MIDPFVLTSHFTLIEGSTTCCHCGAVWNGVLADEALIEHFDTFHNWPLIRSRSIPHRDEPKDPAYQKDRSRIPNGTWNYER